PPKEKKGSAGKKRGAKADTTKNQPEETDSESEKEDEMKEVVFVVENGIAKLRPVKTGISSDTHIEILEGLKEGEEIVVGSYRAISKELRDGKQVKVEKKGAKRFRKKEGKE
ncbi:MAG: efflux transporter periplasmic adaptor subunit, partial [bacterium]